MTRDMIIYVFIIMFTGIATGVSVKLIAMNARLSALLFAPFLPLVAFLFGIIVALKKVNKRVPFLKKINYLIFVSTYNIKNISLLTGLVCSVIAENKIGVDDLINFGSSNLANNFNKGYLRFEKKFDGQKVYV